MTIRQQRAAFIIFSLIVTMALIEIFLRATGIVYRKHRINNKEISVAGDKNVTKILCLGDSFTFGEGAPKSFSYPEQLQKIFDNHPGERYAVYNAGISGQNSSRVLKDLESNIYKYQPDIVVMLIGCNNSNNFIDSNYFLFKGNSIRKYIYRADAFLSHMRSYKLFKSAVVTVSDNIRRSMNSPGKDRFPSPQKDIKNISEGYSVDAARHVDAARTYEAECRIDLAIDECKKAIESDPYNERAYFLLGFIYLHRCPHLDAKKSLELAIENFKKAIRINSFDEESHQNLFNAYYRMGKKDKAIEELRMVYTLNPANKMVNALLTHGLPEYNDINVFKMTLAYDLRNIIRLLAAKNIKLILQNYPASWANEILRETAKGNKIVFADNQAVFEKIQAVSGYKREDYFAQDRHCNAEGYKIMAENIYNALRSN